MEPFSNAIDASGLDSRDGGQAVAGKEDHRLMAVFTVSNNTAEILQLKRRFHVSS